MEKAIRVLVVDDEDDFRETVVKRLNARKLQAFGCKNACSEYNARVRIRQKLRVQFIKPFIFRCNFVCEQRFRICRCVFHSVMHHYICGIVTGIRALYTSKQGVHDVTCEADPDKSVIHKRIRYIENKIFYIPYAVLEV